ncbi:CRISPR-associated endonuclease/helicase Cas3 [Roseivivax halotolerans]|uniref:CRISPR-associated endonuclease/helicase Cas3 n=1 Tax=Roseivivax halotolerans TaxID=93684 RepID=A0A1I6AKE0_9RHOB|nr:CRISPR-associated endonuclease Cas3'' [Roseivivax halotolerans]SFQ69162.1 CRISPR-associated endonuclease/helicase Cas3 [Roseivivax halotolerans]
MREIIAVCRSTKKARPKVAKVLDRYFWRIGDRTWRGKATNACLDRVSRELRKEATRNTAVVLHEIRSAHESRVPIVRIGARHAFSETGIAPIAYRPAQVAQSQTVSVNRAVVRIAALFHDLGKATILFQEKLQRALNGGAPEADPVRHELQSAAVWDYLFGKTQDDELPDALCALRAENVDKACEAVRRPLGSIAKTPDRPLDFDFLNREGSLAHAIGMLILTHHRLPDGGSNMLDALASRHVGPSDDFDRLRDLAIAPGTPFWHETWWLRALRADAEGLRSGEALIGLDVFLRAALMLADHFGSASKKISSVMPEHLANTDRPTKTSRYEAADSLSRHVQRVHAAARHGVDLFERYAQSFPALDESEVPTDIIFPATPENPRFRWQSEAARTARTLCEAHEGGFFACLMAGTGTGKTRAAPTILAGATFGDARPERRSFRMSLGLGLRVLATQSAAEYVSDLGFNDESVSVLVGQAPLSFAHGSNEIEEPDETGSESQIKIPDWLKVEMATGGVPDPGDTREADWLRSLSFDTGRGLPAFFERVLSAADPGKGKGSKAAAARRLVAPPVMVGTIDHLMGVAAPVNARYLMQCLRVATSDLVLDEIDQFEGEDIAAIGRLVYQAASAGRRVMIMSATLAPDIAQALHAAYREGWSAFAASRGVSDHVNILVTGDALGSCRTNGNGERLEDILSESSEVTLAALKAAPPARRAEILPACEGWEDLVGQVDRSCRQLHERNAQTMDGFRVSFGMVRMTRISHTAALAAQLPSGTLENHLRVTLCLHSQFPRLLRSWIETRLKRALTRKGDDPNAELKSLCHAEHVFARASEAGVRDIEIVLVTSPVIETGNDLDFDWAILDPISTRSIIQAAGRVWRHRPASGTHINVLIIGRSPIAMQGGKLAMPGVETKTPDITRISTPKLEEFEGRLFQDLVGDTDLSVINARPILERDTSFPLRDAEFALREKMVDGSCDSAEAPLGRYIRHVSARMTQRMCAVRRFRRSDTHSVLYKLVGEDLRTATWHRDLAPGTRHSDLQPSNAAALTIDAVTGCFLFHLVQERAWQELTGGAEIEPGELGRVMQVEISDYGDDLEPVVTYTDFTGFTRGSFKALSLPFGKAVNNQ